MPYDKQSFEWCAQVREAGVVKVTQALGGIHTVRDGRGGLSPCPSCGGEIRSVSAHDKRGPIGLTRNGEGWCCHRCSARGDAVTLASWLTGQQGRINSQVASACTEAGLVHRERVESRPAAPAGLPHRSSSAEPSYPPAAEVSALLREAYAVDLSSEPSTCDWLTRRGLDPKLLASLNSLLALPDIAPCAEMGAAA